MTPKRIQAYTIVSSVEAVLSRQRELSEPTKNNMRGRIASTIQSASLTDNNLTKDERQALKRLRNDDNIVIPPADKGRVTVVMDKTHYHDKMDELVNDKQTYEVLKRDSTPALQRKLSSKLLQLKKADAIDIRRHNRLRCPVPQPPKLYRLPKPTHVDRLLDKSSYNPTSHKATPLRTLTRRALLVCDSHDSLADEHKYLDDVFSKNNYNCDFVTRNT